MRKHATLGMQVSVLREPKGAKCQKPAKNSIQKKIVKLTDHTYACDSLINFHYEAYAIIGNGNHVNLLKFA